MTQKERVLHALQKHPRGLTQIAFDLPRTVDGGPPIKRVAARIEELRKDGYVIVDAGRAHGCKIYRLQTASAPSAADRPTAVPTPPPLTDALAPALPAAVDEGQLFKLPPAGPYDDLDAAA